MAMSLSRSAEGTARLLGRVQVFGGLSAAELQRVANVAVPRSFPAGSIILREGDRGDTCYVLRHGRARVTRQNADGRAITLTNLGKGEIFGELAMFGGEVRSATVEALEDTEVVAILADDLKRLLKEHPEIAVKLLGALGQRLRDANERISRQSFQTVSSRVAGVLARLIETGSGTSEAGGETSGPSGATGGSDQQSSNGAADIVVHSTQADLAQLAGASREATSRFLANLQRAGVVTCRRGRVIVHDPQALRRYIY
jgi:CRP/FNR family cyclic AMP-dependent transcriptional regulator